jgi:CRP-like cAMP-binding protein
VLTLVEKVLVLAELPLFSEVRSEDLAHVAQAARVHEYDAGETVYLDDDPPDGLHVLVTGSVRLEAGDRSVPVEPGQAFGSWGLLDDEPRRHRALVVKASSVLSLERESFLDVLADHVSVASGMLGSLARGVRDAAARSGGELSDEAARDFG